MNQDERDYQIMLQERRIRELREKQKPFFKKQETIRAVDRWNLAGIGIDSEDEFWSPWFDD